MKKSILSILLLSTLSLHAGAQIITTMAGNGTLGTIGNNGPATAAELTQAWGVYADGSGNVFISGTGEARIRKVNSLGIITSICGTGSVGNAGDGGPATAATMHSPYGITGDAAGNIYFSDYGNNRIRKISTGGTISDFAGGGGLLGDGGPATAGTLNNPQDVAMDATGNMYITDGADFRVRKVNTSGVISTFAGTGVSGYTGNGGPATAAKVANPLCITTDPAGNVYFSDQGSVVRKVDLSGNITTVVGNGTPGYSGDGFAATAAQINAYGVAVDAAGNIYVSDFTHRVIRKVNPSGIINTIAGTGVSGYLGDGGAPATCEFNSPTDLAVDGSGNLYIADWFNNAIRKITQPNTAPLFNVGHSTTLTVAQNSVANPTNSILAITDLNFGQTETWSLVSGPFKGTAVAAYTTTSTGGSITPVGLSYTPNTGYTGLDSFKVRINDGTFSDTTFVHVTVTPFVSTCALNTIATIAGNGIPGTSGDGGPATAANVEQGYGLATDPSGNVYLADDLNSGIRKISSLGIISTIGGTGTPGYNGDGIAATTAQVNGPTAVVADASGNVYVCDNNNNRVRKISASGIMTTIAGTGVAAYLGDNGPATAAQLNTPDGLALDAAGNLYIADDINFRVRKVDPTGIITTVAGTGISAETGDGFPATAAQIGLVSGLAIDGLGNLFLSLSQDHIVRKINTSGIISTVAGNGTIGYSGDNGPATTAQLNFNYEIAADATGNLYIGDWSNHRVRKVDPTGIITTLAGGSVSGFSGDGGPATAAQMVDASGVATDNVGNVYVYDFGNERIRKITIYDTPPTFVGGHTQGLTVCINSTFDPINTLLAIKDADAGQPENWTVVTPPSHGTLSATYSGTSTGSVVTPTGLYYTPTPGFTGSDAFKVQVIDCGTVTDQTTVNVSVVSSLSAGTIVGPSSVCAGSGINLSDATGGGTWASSSTNATVVAGAVSGMSAGTAIISYIVSGSCGSAYTTVPITIVPIPTAIVGFSDVCAGASTALSDGFSGGTWTTSNSAVATINLLTGLAAGRTPGTVTITYILGGICSTSTTLNVDVPIPAIIGPTSACPGANIALSDPLTGGTWNSLSLAVSVNPSSGLTMGITAGTATISYSLVAGCAATLTVTVNPIPDPISGVTDMCAGGTTNTVSDDDPGGIWTSTLVTMTPGGLVTAYAPGSASITYTLPTGCSIVSGLTVNPIPDKINGPGNVCTGFSILLTDTITGGIWNTLDPTVALDYFTDSIMGLSAGTAVISYTLPITGCQVLDTINVYTTPLPISGNISICKGATSFLTDLIRGGAWSVSSGGIASISGTTVTGLLPGVATITYTTGVSCTVTTPVTVLPLPTAFSVTGGGSYCAGGLGEHVLLSSSVPGTRYYLHDGSVIDSLDGTGLGLDYGVFATPGFYTVTATDTTLLCSATMGGSASITIDPIVTPSVSIFSLPGDTVCAGTAITFVTTAGYTGSAPVYQWKVNGSNVGTSTTSYSYTPVNADVVTVEMASNATCAVPATVTAFTTITVNTPVVPDVTVSASPGLSVPIGQSITYTVTVSNATPTTTYQWMNGATPLPGETFTSYTETTPASGDVITCVVNSGGMCPASSTSDKMYVNVFGAGDNVHQLGQGSNISVLPNPNKGTFAITGSVGNSDKDVAIVITDMLGQVVYSNTAIATGGKLNETVLLKNTIASGMYLLKVSSGDDSQVFHVVIEQ